MKKKVISFILIFILIFTFSGCSSNIKKSASISGKDTLIENVNNNIIVDVRTKEEYDSGHIKNAINIPYENINEKINLDKTKTIMVYCKSGARSKIAFGMLKRLGYEVVDLGAYDSINMEKTK